MGQSKQKSERKIMKNFWTKEMLLHPTHFIIPVFSCKARFRDPIESNVSLTCATSLTCHQNGTGRVVIPHGDIRYKTTCGLRRWLATGGRGFILRDAWHYLHSPLKENLATQYYTVVDVILTSAEDTTVEITPLRVRRPLAFRGCGQVAGGRPIPYNILGFPYSLYKLT